MSANTPTLIKPPKNITQYVHLKDVCDLPNQIHNYNSCENVDSGGTFYKSVDIIQQYGYKDNVEDVNDTYLQKIEWIQMKFFIKLSKIHQA